VAISKLKSEEVKTIEEFEAFIVQPENADRRFELINGRVVEKMPTQLHGWIVVFLSRFLLNYLDVHRIGRLYAEARYKMPDSDDNARIPDLSFVRNELGPVVKDGPAPYMPDLAIEVQSPDDTPKLMREKADYYLANGSRMVWLIFTGARSSRVEVYRLGQPMQTIGMNDILDGGDVLPGFTVVVQSLFPEE
jgi:Uma2 family endonuclease